MVFVKPGEPRPITIPKGKKDVAPFIISNLCRQLEVKKKELARLV